MISGMAFDRPDSLSQLRAFPDHFKIYMILPIVHIKNSTLFKQSIKVDRLCYLGHLWSSG